MALWKARSPEVEKSTRIISMTVRGSNFESDFRVEFRTINLAISFLVFIQGHWDVCFCRTRIVNRRHCRGGVACGSFFILCVFITCKLSSTLRRSFLIPKWFQWQSAFYIILYFMFFKKLTTRFGEWTIVIYSSLYLLWRVNIIFWCCHEK